MTSNPPSSPVETTGADSGTREQRWDLDAPYATWDLLDLIAYIDHWRDQCAALTVEVERQQVWAAKYWRERQSARAEVEDLTLDLEAANAMIGRVQAVLTHCHADTCATELSPHAGYDCTCWRGDLIAALEATP